MLWLINLTWSICNYVSNCVIECVVVYCMICSLIQLLVCKLHINSHTVHLLSHVGHTRPCAPQLMLPTVWVTKVPDGSCELWQHCYCIHSTHCFFNYRPDDVFAVMRQSVPSWPQLWQLLHSYGSDGSWVSRLHDGQVSNDVDIATTGPGMTSARTTTNL